MIKMLCLLRLIDRKKHLCYRTALLVLRLTGGESQVRVKQWERGSKHPIIKQIWIGNRWCYRNTIWKIGALRTTTTFQQLSGQKMSFNSFLLSSKCFLSFRHGVNSKRSSLAMTTFTFTFTHMWNAMEWKEGRKKNCLLVRDWLWRGKGNHDSMVPFAGEEGKTTKFLRLTLSLKRKEEVWPL